MFCYLLTDYIFVRERNRADRSMRMEACGSECVDRSMWMGVLGGEHGNVSLKMQSYFHAPVHTFMSPCYG